ncbi:MAG TPA: hypothetical protein DEO54_05720 [Rikenellaceae bacterium]|nr:hypothetical protein [Rikenellaceae bacterium]HBZ25726.1 hypothetical protein [Rikenellaceae bacterium]
MKRAFVFTIYMLITFGIYAQGKGVVFQNITLQEALKKAKESKKGPKLIFMDCYTDWCGPCKEMTNNVFPQEVCGTFFNANFINVKFDMEKGEGLDIAKRYSVSVYPTFLILDSDGNEVNRVIGSDRAENFIEKVKIAMDPANAPKAKYEVYNKERSSENLYAYITSLRNAYKNNELNTFVNDVFFTLKPNEKYSEVIWGALTSPVGAFSNSGSEIFKYLLLNRFEAEKFISKSKIDEHLLKTFKVFFMRYISGNIPQEMLPALERNMICANALFSNDFGMGYLMKMATLKEENKLDELFKMLDYRAIYRGTSLDLEMIEKSFIENRNLTQEQKVVVAKYFEGKQAVLARDAENAKRWVERLNSTNK